MVKALVVAAFLWPAVMGAAVWQRATGADAAWTIVPYVIGSQICHQRPDRSFHTHGVQWPVCGRCSGLYLAAPAGALAALMLRRRRVPGPWPSLIVASLPTIATLGLEWGGLAAVTNLARAIAALPIAAAVAFWIVRVADGRSSPISYTAES